MFEAKRAEWDSQAYFETERYEAWRTALNDTYGEFDVAPDQNKNFDGRLVSQSVPSFTVVDCVCDPCNGKRRSREISRDDRSMLGVQLILYGKENMTIGDRKFRLGAGDIVLWDSSRNLDFEVVERMRKVSVLLPLNRLRDWFPVSWRNYDNVVDGRVGTGRLLASFMRSLSPRRPGNVYVNGEALSESTFGLLCNAVSTLHTPERDKLRHTQLLTVQAHIESVLRQPDLKLPDIAAANRISIRYLHWLFEPLNVSVSEYIMQRRLENCAKDLRNPLMAKRSITEICYSWGFASSTHFSRRFRKAYDESPSEYRLNMMETHGNTLSLATAAN